MGCYAAIHALKMADVICKAEVNAKVLIVCTELCTLHFQREATMDNIASSLLFSDGSAAVLVTADSDKHKGLRSKKFLLGSNTQRKTRYELGAFFVGVFNDTQRLYT